MKIAMFIEIKEAILKQNGDGLVDAYQKAVKLLGWTMQSSMVMELQPIHARCQWNHIHELQMEAVLVVYEKTRLNSQTHNCLIQTPNPLRSKIIRSYFTYHAGVKIEDNRCPITQYLEEPHECKLVTFFALKEAKHLMIDYIKLGT